jgi:hypothetical protein
MDGGFKNGIFQKYITPIGIGLDPIRLLIPPLFPLFPPFFPLNTSLFCAFSMGNRFGPFAGAKREFGPIGLG